MKIKKRQSEILGSEISADLPAFSRPAFVDKIRWPDDITQLTAQNISELLGKYTSILCYAESQLSKYRQEIISIEFSIHKYGVGIYIEEPRIVHLEKNKRLLKIDSDEGMLKMKARLAQLRKFEVASEMFVKNYERLVSALSRELSRKTSSGDGMKYSRFVKE